MKTLYQLMLLAAITACGVGYSHVETVNANCEQDNDRETCIILDVDYRLEHPNYLNISNAGYDMKDRIVRVKILDGRYEIMPLNLFQLFPNLVTLRISTGLQAIAQENLVGGSGLKSLILSDNEITEIKAHTFDEMDKLEEIYLRGNNLTKIEFAAFAGAIQLKHLDLSRNNIETIADGAFNITTLVDIDLSYNTFQTLADDVFVGCPNLTGIYLYGNRLTLIRKSMDNVPKLSTLLLDNKNDKIFDFDFYAIARKPHLRHFSSRGVGLLLFDRASAANDSYTVEHLDITGNNLPYTDILHRLRNFRNLTWLEMGKNNFMKIDDIENILAMFPKLKRLEFDELPCRDDVIKRLQTKFGDKIRFTFGRAIVFN